MDISVRITRDENAEYFGVEVGDVVQIPFEQYVAGVVASEVGNSALEVCKAQAVASRTFAVSKGVLDGKTISDSSSSDQAYRASRIPSGLYPNAENGTKQTAGEILTYNGQPINAVYSASNGGRTVSSQERWGGVRPYLIAQDDPWDDSTKRTGHGVGMSQRGAKAMAKAGKTYKEILSFYYPGAQIETIQEKGGGHIVTAQAFIDKVWIPLNEGWGYIYGTWGTLWTEAKQQAATREQTVKYGAKWIGHMVTDCSGLVRWALNELGEKIVHHATYQYTDWCNKKGKLVDGQRTDGKPILPGTLVFLQGSQDKIHHVGVYVGDGIVIEAKGTQSGVVTSSLTKWDHWGECKLIDYSNAADSESAAPERPQKDILFKAEVTNPNTWLNVRSGPGKNYPVQFQAQRGTIVDVLAESDGWYQIRTGGRIGWASADYLTPLAQEEPSIQPDHDVELPLEELSVLPEIMDRLASIQTRLTALVDDVNDVANMLDDMQEVHG